MNRLKQLERYGQSLWLDYLRRDLIEGGQLRTLVERDGLKGVTSNPSIFEKAIAETDEYANALKELEVRSDHNVSAIYEELRQRDRWSGPAPPTCHPRKIPACSSALSWASRRRASAATR